MELVAFERKIRCEMGACKNFAAFSVKMNRLGVRSRLHICEQCLRELGKLINEKVGDTDAVEAENKGVAGVSDAVDTVVKTSDDVDTSETSEVVDGVACGGAVRKGAGRARGKVAEA